MDRAKKGKVVGVCGSPRKGNTEYLLKMALEGAAKAGAETELILLREMGRIQKRDVEEFDSLVDATGVILGSPDYDHNVTELMKAFMANLKPLAGTGMLANKKGGVIAVGSGSLKSIKGTAKVLEDFLQDSGVTLEKTITIIADKPDDARKQKSALGAAMELGKKVVGE